MTPPQLRCVLLRKDSVAGRKRRAAQRISTLAISVVRTARNNYCRKKEYKRLEQNGQTSILLKTLFFVHPTVRE